MTSRSRPPEAWAPLLRLRRTAAKPLDVFLRIEAASGIVLLLAAVLALLCANSTLAPHYHAFWHTPLGVRIGEFRFERPLEWFVNDALMVVFFFVVGLEIRREVHQGELSEWRRAVLPAAAALGGMLAPALLYTWIASLHGGWHVDLQLSAAQHTRAGWGVPMATDIAFALGILTLLGKRVPPALRVLLLALAVIDDLGAILVIAVFYSSGVNVGGFAIAACAVAGIFAMQRAGIRNKLAYVPLAVIVWAGIYSSGVHPTIAGVLIGVITPVRTWFGLEGFVAHLRDQLSPLRDVPESAIDPHVLSTRLQSIDRARREALSPATSLIEALHPWVAFGIMPVFALANAGVSLDGLSFDEPSLRVMLGSGLGLLLGKPIGVLLATRLTLATGLARLPRGLSTRHVLVLGVVAGVGFTMALFVAQLAFEASEALRLLAAAKSGVLAGSAAAAVLTLGLGRALLGTHLTVGAAETAQEAERSTEL